MIFEYLLERRRVSFTSRKRIRSGVRHREIHFCSVGRAEITIRSRFLHLVKGITEHLIVRFLAVEKEINGFSDLLVLDLTAKI